MRNGITSANNNVPEFIQCLVGAGVKNMVVSPGSRNAPLVIAADEHPDLDCVLIHDERSAGFVALGMSIQTQQPTAVVCTSGSAAANYLPAVVEAFYQEVPLIVITADRPQEWINHGDGQTIMQEQLFGQHVKHYRSLDDQDSFDEQDVLKVLQEAQIGGCGPVHFNFSLHEPLYETRPIEFPEYQGLNLSLPATNVLPPKLLTDWGNAEKKMVLVGQMPPDENLLNQLKAMAFDPSVVVLTENTANLHDSKFISCIDRTIEGLTETDVEFCPDILITLGGAVVSKKIKKLLRQWDIPKHYRVSFNFPEMDTYRHLTQCIEARPSQVIKSLNEFTTSAESSEYQSKWKGRDYRHQSNFDEYLKKVDFSDLLVFKEIMDHIPDYVHLHLGNSSVVRYSQLFNPLLFLRYSCNRGTSGIDGSLSTAVGAAMADPESLHLCVLGDVSFLYDSNAMWNNHFPKNLKIIVIDNGGGGIFEIIPGPKKTKQLDKFFFARNNSFQLKSLFEVFHLNVRLVNQKEMLRNELFDLFSFENDARLDAIVIQTFNCRNSDALNNFFVQLRS